jgi:hypothetical protein
MPARDLSVCSCGRGHRPTFHIWADGDAWRWCCTLCSPQVRGCRFIRYYGDPAYCLYRIVIGVSMRHHFRCRDQHHAWVAGAPPMGCDR